jgi:hypothetical protein
MTKDKIKIVIIVVNNIKIEIINKKIKEKDKLNKGIHSLNNQLQKANLSITIKFNQLGFKKMRRYL